MLTRRFLLLSSPVFAVTALASSARAAEPAVAFIEQSGKELLVVVNGSASIAQKQADMQIVVDRVVDSDAVAQFCLGRFWRVATPEQRQTYLRLFHRVLMKSITGRLGDYQGVTITVGRSVARDGDIGVASVITRPNAAPANVEWVVNTASGSPRIVDVVAEGTSMRLTQRSDYASYLNQHGGSVDALLAAMKQQADAR